MTHYQQVGLANIVEWLGSAKSSSEVCFVTTAIGFKHAAMMLWCLPSMLEWADNNQLIPDGTINLSKPLLILCTKKESVDLWNMVHSKSAFHQSSLLRSVSTCSDGKSLSYLATDAESACNIGSVAEQYKLVLSDIGCLEDLPGDAFSQIIAFKEGDMSSYEVNAISTKYAQKSSIIYFTAHPVGPMKKFELQNNCPSSLKGQNDNSAAGDITSGTINEPDIQNAASCPTVEMVNPLSSHQEILEEEFEEECEDIEIIILPPDSTPLMADSENVEDEVREEESGNVNVQEAKEGACHVHVQEHMVSMEESTPVEVLGESMPDKKKNKKWRRVFKKKAKVQKIPQQNAFSQEDSYDSITTKGHSTQHTQPDIDSPELKKTSKWSKCKTFFRNISKNRKGRKRRNPPNNCSIDQSLEIAEDINNENHSTGLFMCWRRRTSKNSRVSTSSSDPGKESESANEVSGPMTWTDPVTYLSNIRPNAYPEDTQEEAQEEDALSFASVVLSITSSLDTISLLERDYSEKNDMCHGANTLDLIGEVDNELIIHHDHDDRFKVLSHESIISHPNAMEHYVITKTENEEDYNRNTTTKNC